LLVEAVLEVMVVVGLVDSEQVQAYL